MQRICAAIVIVGFFGTAFGASAQMTSTNYEIRWDTIGAGGDDVGSSASYILRDTAGGTAIGPSSSTSFDLNAGYRGGIGDQIIDFSFFAEDSTSSREASSVAGQTITCSTTGLATGDLIALVQDVGSAQVTAIGKISSIGAGSITVDSLTDDGTAPVIDGSNDVVVLLEGTTIDLSELEATEVSTSVIGIEVTADVSGGYVVQIMDDGDLRDGTDTVDDVADGSVTEGSEEYGARSSDTTLSDSSFDTTDSAITTVFQDITTVSGSQFSNRSFITLKAAIDANTADGNYAHAITLIVSGNY